MAKEVIAVIGAGGKTTALELLAVQSKRSPVLVTTTTHIFPTEAFPCLADPSPEEMQHPGILWAGSASREGKLGILPQKVLEAGLAHVGLVVYEADGARMHPLKLHRDGEPVILPQTTHCLILAGLSALGKPIEEVVHRREQNPGWKPGQLADIEVLVHCVLETAAASGFPKEKTKVFLNQADTLGDSAAAHDAAVLLQALGLDTRYGSLREAPGDLYSWVTGWKCP